MNRTDSDRLIALFREAAESTAGSPSEHIRDDEVLIAAWVTDTLDPAERERFFHHLDACSTCRKYVAGLVPLLPEPEIPEPIASTTPVVHRGFPRLVMWGAFALAACLLVAVGWVLTPTRDSVELARATRDLQAGRADEALARLKALHPERLQDHERTELPTLVEKAAYESASKALADRRFDDAVRACEVAAGAEARSARLDNLRLLATEREEVRVPGELTLTYRGSLLDRGFEPKGGRKARGGPPMLDPDRQAAWGKAAGEHPDSVLLQLNYGEFLVSIGKHREAVEVFRHVIELDPKNTAAHLGLGVALVADERDPERFEKALAAFLQAEALDPDSLAVQLNIAVCLEAQGNPQAAQRYWERALPRVTDPTRRDQITDLLHSKK